ncbi:probable carotenoid cleavage dioxygenase 4, chloroplastic [Salvia hispanica]|uniref:probable carotenoid cleavage dioxygenase 4, chloroplastic n=1 Tax=Salvia hispanica TaxID=49212 RepID=UPI002009DB17|nr:probable carotenoid cleavage dioxygenase 4, chloroplastic [Salvia hispanica]
METLILHSTFIPRNLDITINSNNSHPHQLTLITAKSSSTIFHNLTKNSSTIFHNLTKNLPKYDQTIIKSPLPIIFKSLDDFICNVIDLPLPPSLDPKHVLSGNFAPVSELPPTACDAVEGSLPACLDGGAYIRNGPNPHFFPNGPYHLFEGDGMLHMIKFSHGKPTFCCRYVNTHKHAVEREIGYPFVPSIFSSFNGGLLASISRFFLTTARVIAGQFDPINHGLGPANTSLALISNRLFALCESDLPYAIEITAEGDLKTLGRHDFGIKSAPFPRMTAHPKIDCVTGEAFAYEYVGAPPSLKLFRIDSDGKRQKHVPISMEKFTAIHDFAVTERYAVIPDVQIVVNPWSILKGRSPVEVDREKVARLGVIPRYAEDEGEMVWIEAAGFNPVHCASAWEEDGGDTVCVVASNAVAVDKLLENVGSAEMRMEKIVVDVKGKRVVRRQRLSPEILDFGVINPAYAAKKHRYIYAAIVSELRLIGVVKLDLSIPIKGSGGDCAVASRRYGPGCHGSEPFFVAREPNNPIAEEDDGYLVTYLHDDKTQESKFIVMDAKSPNLDIIAAVKLPQRIPTGFHGLFLSESDLNKLRQSC